MRIVIDLQGAQTESRFRGVGRYSVSLTKAMIRNRGEHEIMIVLSDLFPNTIESIRAEFDGLLPQENIRVWNAIAPVREYEYGNSWRREAAELIRETFLMSLQPDIVYITSLFEGYVDDAVTSILKIDQTTPVSISFYDLIPLLNPDHYLKPNPVYEQYYQRKIDYLQHASLLLAISEFSKQEGKDCLDQYGAEIVNISAAVDANFCTIKLSNTQIQNIKDKFGLSRAFILYTGGADERKNLSRLIHAYACLPSILRETHQLLFAGRILESNVNQLQKDAKLAGLNSDELVFTGYVTDDELVKLYNLCELYVFPSWHEGFGLPALEAMSCGAAVIGANTSSLPEVIGNEDALFDPYSIDSITNKIKYALTNDAFRIKLKHQGSKQAKKFSWDSSAIKAIAAFEKLHSEQQQLKAHQIPLQGRPSLAYISPLPPEPSGISDYSAELLPALSQYYEVDVIVDQASVSDAWINENCQIRDVEWFRLNEKRYDRILYHFGNSPFHQHMFNLLDEIPGIVILHDFFLSGIVAHMDIHGISPNGWAAELYRSHGYQAVHEYFCSNEPTDIVLKYPCNFRVLQAAQGIIVHSENSQRLVASWYSSIKSEDWAVIPLLRFSEHENDRLKARQVLGFKPDDFAICCFGFLDPSKLNHRMLEAWLASDLAKNNHCVLLFVGKNHGGDYGEELLEMIHNSGLSKRISITGWTDLETFRYYLAAADVGVQLRTHSRGETSAAVLDCMNYSLPTIVNANGSMADLPDDVVVKLADEFSNEQLIKAIENLWRDVDYRKQLGDRAREHILTYHSPQGCALQYFAAIENFYKPAQMGRQSLIQAIAGLDGYQSNDHELIQLADSIAQNHPVPHPDKQLLIDISATHSVDNKTGIERVVRSILLELIKLSPQGFRVEPVYLSNEGGNWHYRYARVYTADLLEYSSDILLDEPIEILTGDVVFALDLFGQGLVDAQTYLDKLHRHGAYIFFLVHDLLPVLLPEVFPLGADHMHTKWLNVIARYDGAICVSNTVADDLRNWLKNSQPERYQSYTVNCSHHGADLKSSAPSSGLPEDSLGVLKIIREHPSFLMVGTLEPRKGYGQALTAFEQLWAAGRMVNLVIVGHEGWKALPDEARRTIPDLIDRLNQHPEINKRLFWLEGISDEYLEKVYAASTCLIAASEGEGFGLPLIEAAQHKLPIIARDIPVFKEVAGEYAYYFNNSDKAIELADTLVRWLELYKENKHPGSANMPWLTWKDSVKQLFAVIKKLI